MLYLLVHNNLEGLVTSTTINSNRGKKKEKNKPH